MKKNIYIDERWSGNHGIGIVTNFLLSFFHAKPLNIHCSKLSIFNPFFFSLRLYFLPINSIVINPGFNAPFLFPKKYYFYIHDIMHVKFYKNPLVLLYYKFYLSYSIKKAAKVFTVSEFSRNEIINFFNLKNVNKVINISNGVSKNLFKKNYKKRLLNYNYILCVSNRKKHKNEFNLLKAFSLVNDKVKFHLVFTGNPDRNIKKQIATLNLNSRVKFFSNLTDDDMVSLYKHSLALISPSFYEGFNLPIVESMASKTAVIASDIPVHREVTKGNAIFFDPHNPSSLSTILVNLEYFIKNDIVQKAYKTSRNFTWDKVGKKIQSIIIEDDFERE
jgi:glycosyltransferase involved in cell wall biosynthesis